MKLLRYGEAGHERPGLLDAGGQLRDLSSLIPDLGPGTLDDATLAWLRALDPDTLPVVATPGRLGPCVAGVGKFVCIGLNYRDHADETGAPYPAEPILFMKATSSIQGPDDDVILPRGSVKSDWEVELGVVIGRAAKHVTEAQALDFVAGYCVINDLSEREFQIERGGTWDKGKGCDTFGPLGPWLVTRDEVPDPQALRLWLDLDGVRRQDGTTANMIFTVAQIVSYVSDFMTLHPGDVISTGTPHGVGLGCTPPEYLRAGQVMKLGIEGLGVQTQQVRAFETAP
ncbi:fumarylacetoacetate hydrolase family protein [Deinococcus sp. KSM4-11]|uniref:fumarylacetoacetate hydrolase family protein n=1 Tax=Deinococcus sp. KSM4-11 TaxID=2568654 RepID=UPI0010A372A5|nr:fumarylacetoacetate hydrolase family protein [Deinococcus sp. KSM4-11]THF87363.1 fumarylacetoacetate hydrolase family protein [Deinococcus sp. KSM4-11]